MAPERRLVFGPIRGVPVGRRFKDRAALKAAGIHGNLTPGIYGRKEEGASSIVLSGGFADEDHGTHFTYIGSGGRESGDRFGDQIEDQSWDNPFNAALKKSAELEKPVRVTRGPRLTSRYAPAEGYRYDGIYTVSNPRIEDGARGHKVCKFDFQRCPGQLPLPSPDAPAFYELSDIEIRRKEFIRYRKPDGARSESGEASGSQDGSADVDALSEPGVDDDGDDENDLFGDINDIEQELEPVLHYLEKVQAAETPKKDRAKALLHIGRRVRRVLESKSQQGADEAGRDGAWWYSALWTYVGCAIPTKPDEKLVRDPEGVEQIYEKQEQRAKHHKEKKERERAELDQ